MRVKKSAALTEVSFKFKSEEEKVAVNPEDLVWLRFNLQGFKHSKAGIK